MKFDQINTVVLVTGKDRREMVREALTKLGEEFQKRVKTAKQIFLHSNTVTPNNQSACTHVDSLRGVLDHISLLTKKQILIGDASFYDTKKAFKNYHYESLSRSGNIKLLDLNDDETVESFAYTQDFKKRPLGFSKTVATSDLNIVVVPAKMHSYYTVSLSIKTHIVGSQIVSQSPFGIHARWPWLHTGYKQAHMTLADAYIDYPAQLAIIDGTAAMEGNGPTSGREVNLEWVLVSFNPIAADALASYLMGWDPSTEIGYLYFLKEKGYGPIDIDKIKIKGPDPESLRKTLSRPDAYPEILEWR